MATVADRGEITRLLQDWQDRDPRALDRLMPVVHAELRRIARVHMRGEARECTLQPTALVNEVYLRLTQLRDMRWQDRAHFFAMASRLIRRVLVEAGRARHAGKRGRSVLRVSLDEGRVAGPGRPPDVVALDAALTDLAVQNARKARVVELRFFGGLSVEETAAVLDVSVETVFRDWRFAKLWLRRALSKGGA